MESLRWSPSGTLVALAWIGAAAAGGWCALLVVSGSDPAGSLLAGTAAVALAVGAVYGTVARPRLRADHGGITVRGLTGSRRHPWTQVTDMRLLRTRRFGRDTTLLALDLLDADGRERLALFGRLDLDDDPEDVVVSLRAQRGH